MNIQESKIAENIILKVTILTSNKARRGENRGKEVGVTGIRLQKPSCCQSFGNPKSLIKERISKDESELISNSIIENEKTTLLKFWMQI